MSKRRRKLLGVIVHIDSFLKLLDCCNPTKNGHVARCPAHDDKGPSLSVKEGNDGRILVHCFAGCSAGEICSSVGLKLSDLMPENDDFYNRRLADGDVIPYFSKAQIDEIDTQCLFAVCFLEDLRNHQEIHRADANTYQKIMGNLCNILGRLMKANHVLQVARIGKVLQLKQEVLG